MGVKEPYFPPPPEDWAKHKHLNVPQGKYRFSEQEYSLFQLGAMFEKSGIFEVEKKKVKKTLVKGNGGFFFKNLPPRILEALEDEEAKLKDKPEEDA